jgi:hypothetical protein
MAVYTCHPNYLGRVTRCISIQAHPGLKARPYLKIIQSKKKRETAQVVQQLPRKSKTLSSNPSTTKKKEK